MCKLGLFCSEKLRLTTRSQHKECTPNSCRLHEALLHYHVKSLKQQLRQDRIDSSAFCHARDITTDVKLPKSLIKGPLEAPHLS